MCKAQLVSVKNTFNKNILPNVKETNGPLLSHDSMTVCTRFNGRSEQVS